MNCSLCAQPLAETDQFCTQCGATLVAEQPIIEAISFHGRIQLYSTFVRIVHEEKKKVTQVADVPYTEISKVSIRKDSWFKYLQILRPGETPTETYILNIMELPTTLNIAGVDTKAVVQLYQELQQRSLQAEFTSCFDKTPIASKPPENNVPTAPSDQIIAIGINGKMVAEKGIIRLTVSGIRGERVLAVKQIKGFEYSPATGGLFSRNGKFQISSDSLTSFVGANALSFQKKNEAEFVAIKQIIEAEMAK